MIRGDDAATAGGPDGHRALLRLLSVWKDYGGNWALRDVSMTVVEGQVHALIGPNGAGKSTLFGVVSGEYRAARGQVELFGKIRTDGPARRTRHGLARAFQVAKVFPGMTVRENLTVAAVAAARESGIAWRVGPSRSTRRFVDELLGSHQMVALAEHSAATLAQGDRKRLEIAMALASRPRLLLLDEPTAGMSQEETDQTVSLIRRLYVDHGTTVLISEHDMHVVFALAHTVTVLHHGEVLCSGDPATVRPDPRVVAAYLGEEG